MDFEWVAIDLFEAAWIALAFVLGLAARLAGLPPLVGYLVAGFILSTQSPSETALIQKLSDLGITLLLFTVGLKINLRSLIRPQVWAVSGIHMAFVVGLFGLLLYGLAFSGLPLLSGLDLGTAFLFAFALSFSSTVFAVKVLEERGEMNALLGQIAIGILIMQDIAAVVFLAVSTGQTPSILAPALLLLVFLIRPLGAVLNRVGHGELLALYGFFLALGGAELFELFGLKGDLGALIAGLLVASHRKSDEMAKTMLGFKDLFLVGFFLSIGLSVEVSPIALVIGVALTPVVVLKAGFFFWLLTRGRLRARTALLTSLNLANYSEFGLIVAAVGVANGWLKSDWLVVLSVAVSLSFVLGAILSNRARRLYRLHSEFFTKWQSQELLPDDRPLDIGPASTAVFGMGGVGTGAFDSLRENLGETVVGVDINPETVANHRSAGRNVLLGDPSDADFWDRVQERHRLGLVLLTLPKIGTSLRVLRRLQEVGFSGRVAAIARYADETEALREAGADTVYNINTEAGSGFASHVESEFGSPARPS